MRVYRVIELDVPDLSGRIRQERIDKGISTAEVCRRTGLSKTHWTRIEKGQNALPIDTLRNIEKALGTSFGVDLG